MKPLAIYIKTIISQQPDRLWLSLAAVVTALFVAAMVWGR